MFSKLSPKQPNAVAVLTAFIKKLNIPVSSFTIATELVDHPDYPSLLALSDCLNSWKIQHEAIKLEKDFAKIENLSFPFIAHLKTDEGQFMLIHEVNNDQVKFTNENKKKGLLSKDDFLKNWDGIILYAEKDELSGEENYKQSLIKGTFDKARLPFFALITILSIIYILSTKQISPPYLLLIILKLSGIIITSLLLIHSINGDNPFISNLCNLSKKNDCNAILKSDTARITDWLNWSEVGMFYFSGSFVSLLLNQATVGTMSWLNLLCLPYTLYSIGYQYKTKNWCILCCSVQVILWLEAITFYIQPSSFRLEPFSLSNLGSIILFFIIPIAIWSFVKPFLQKASQAQPLRQQLKKFKYNSNLFNQFLTSQTKHPIPYELAPISLGNPKASTTITIVSNPFCNPCAVAHKTLNEWINNRDDIQLKVIFTAAKDDNRAKMAKHAIALSLFEDKEIVENALNDWYNESDKKYEVWAEKYPVILDEKINTIIEMQKKWCESADISFTPTIFINGYKLVDPYKLNDIKYLIANNCERQL